MQESPPTAKDSVKRTTSARDVMATIMHTKKTVLVTTNVLMEGHSLDHVLLEHAGVRN